MKLVEGLTVAMAVLLFVASAEAHEQQAVVGGQHVQPTPKMIEELKKEHGRERQAKPAPQQSTGNRGRPSDSWMAGKDSKERTGKGYDEGGARQGK